MLDETVPSKCSLYFHSLSLHLRYAAYLKVLFLFLVFLVVLRVLFGRAMREGW